MLNRVLLWGMGAVYNKYINLVKRLDGEEFDVVGVTSSLNTHYTMLDGYEIIKREELNDHEIDYVMAMSDDHFIEILNVAVEQIGIPSTKVFPARVIAVPGFSMEKWSTIANSELSIVSNNCWGGILFNTLGLEYRSPFKNVSFSDEDYIRLLENFNYYMEASPRWDGDWDIDTNSGKQIPLLWLNDVRIRCNHELNPDEAIKTWNRRRKKINYENLLFEMYTESRTVAERFDALNLGNRICFTPFETSMETCVTITKESVDKKYFETINGMASMKKSNTLNLFSILLGEKIFRMS